MTINKRLQQYTEIPPNRQDPVNYSPRADYLAAYIPPLAIDIGVMADEFNATASEVNTKTNQATQAASNAQLAATAAQSSANYAGVFTPGATNAIAGKSYFYNNRIWTCTANTSQTPSYPSNNWFAGLGRFDIVGTVSQSGGVPTGAIIQQGSNVNGEFTRLADGTQICIYSKVQDIPASQEVSYGANHPASFLVGSSPAVSFSWSVSGDAETRVDNFRSITSATSWGTLFLRLTRVPSAHPILSVTTVGLWA